MKVLIIDDEALVRRSLEKAFRLRGHEVLLAEDGEKGLALWLQFRPNAVLIDVLMPGLTGPQVISQIGVEVRAHCFVAAMSAFSGSQSEFESSEGPRVDLFISKPFDDVFSVVERMEKNIKVEV